MYFTDPKQRFPNSLWTGESCGVYTLLILFYFALYTNVHKILSLTRGFAQYVLMANQNFAKTAGFR